MIRGIHHPGIVVTDLGHALEFYCGVLDFECVLEFSWAPSNDTINQIIGLNQSAADVRLLRTHNSYLELFKYHSPSPSTENANLGAHEPGIRHIGFEVDDAFAVYEKVSRYDEHLVMNEPVSFDSGGSAVYCRDPFGNLIEFTTAGRGFPSLEQLNKFVDQADFTAK